MDDTMNAQYLEAIVGGVSQEAIKHWLKISGLPHTAGNKAEFYKLLNKLITADQLRVERLRRLVLEIKEYREKRIYLGKLSNYKVIGLKQRFENHLNSIREKLVPDPVEPKELPSKPHLNYICWSHKEVRIGYSETHEFEKLNRTTKMLETHSRTNLIIISAEPSTGLIKIMMDAPGDEHQHIVTQGARKIDGYVPFYKNRALDLLGAEKFNPIDLRKISEGIVKSTPKIFEPTDFHALSSHHSRYRITSRSDVTDDPVFSASEKADKDRVHDGVSGFWLPESSEGQLQRKLYMQLSVREDMIRFDAECLANEVEYAISRIRAV